MSRPSSGLAHELRSGWAMRPFVAVFLSTAFACSSAPSPSDSGVPPAPTDGGSAADAASADAANADAADALDAVVEADASALDATVDDDASAADAGTTAGPTFTRDVFPMFESFGCTSVACHGSLRAQGGAVVYLPNRASAFADLVQRRSIREPRLLVEPGSPLTSVLFTHGRDANIPAGDLDAAGLALIGDWITVGAPFGEDVVPPPPPVPTTCSVAELPGAPPLPAACLPRCTAETWAAVAACRTEPDVSACQNAVIAADTSTVIDLDFGPELGTLPLDCNSCLDLQTETCFVEHCLADYLAATRCRLLDASPSACVAEVNQAVGCAQATPAFRTCQVTRDAQCAAR